MEKLDLKQVPKKLKPNPLFKGLPKDLKDPKCFEGIQNQLRDVMKSEHRHTTVKAFVTCAWCQANMKKKQDLMKALGFKSINQYMEWVKIMTIITQKKNFELK